MISLFSGDIIPFTVPKWLTTLVYLVASFEVGVANLPFFACLSTTHRGLGGALGLMYTLAWLIVAVWKVRCVHAMCDESLLGSVMCYQWLMWWPYFLCLGFLMFRFGIMLAREVKNRLQKNNEQVDEDEVLQSHQYRYVQTLLRRPERYTPHRHGHL
ncbi:hypothetical protein NFI96_000515 [Prochilodus magdalenae]|nr:hypothetical protein NFI96_000515 [Prochilodus magdalenae]